jgi:hypothetical protein
LLRPALAGLAAAFTLAGCIHQDGKINVVGNDVCPDPQRPLPFPVVRPACWTDKQWAGYLKREKERAGDLDTRYRDQF